jgi:hypothetical protein
MPSDPSWDGFGMLNDRAAPLQAVHFQADYHDIFILFSEEGHAALAAKLFERVPPDPKVRLALIPDFPDALDMLIVWTYDKAP